MNRTSRRRFLQQATLAALADAVIAVDALGADEIVSFALTVEPTFVPAKIEAGNGDGRELGIRVFHAYLTTEPGGS